MRAALLVVVAFALVSGCTEPPPQVQGEEQGLVPGILHMERCLGVNLGQTYLPGTNPAPVPQGWEAVDDDETVISLWLWQCPRVGLDHLERPATLLWEVTNGVRPPAECAFGDNNRASVVLSAWTDDEEFASHFSSTYQLPVRSASFEYDSSATGHRWNWTVGGEASHVEAVWFEDPYRREARDHGRWVWPTEAGVGWMDLNQTTTQNLLLSSVARGELGPSHRLGIEGRFAGMAFLVHDAEWFGRIDTGGPQCD